MDLIFQSKHHIAGNIWTYVFEPSEPIAWTAGQFIRVELPHPNPDEEGTKRFFTISSAPHERAVHITTRYTSSSFKQVLAGLTPGRTLRLLDQPSGNFTWRNWPHPLVFVAQGIGITPFYAIIKDRLHHGLPVPATLLYANYAPEVPFKRELTTWTESGLALTLSSQPFTAAQLAELVPNLSSHLVYVSGPDSLVTLLGPPANLPTNQLMQDSFPNYSESSY